MNKHLQRSKLFPNIVIDDEIHRFDYFDLQAIIWHHGQNFDVWHYSCDVKANGIWYKANDAEVRPESPTLDIIPDGYKAPYIIVYKKGNTEIIPCNIREPKCESDQYETKTTTTRSEKRQSEVFVYKLENMTFNFGKRKHNYTER